MNQRRENIAKQCLRRIRQWLAEVFPETSSGIKKRISGSGNVYRSRMERLGYGQCGGFLVNTRVMRKRLQSAG